MIRFYYENYEIHDGDWMYFSYFISWRNTIYHTAWIQRFYNEYTCISWIRLFRWRSTESPNYSWQLDLNNSTVVGNQRVRKKYWIPPDVLIMFYWQHGWVITGQSPKFSSHDTPWSTHKQEIINGIGISIECRKPKIPSALHYMSNDEIFRAKYLTLKLMCSGNCVWQKPGGCFNTCIKLLSYQYRTPWKR